MSLARLAQYCVWPRAHGGRGQAFEETTNSVIMELTKVEALRAYARMMNRLDVGCIEPYLADDFCFASQMVLEELESKTEFLDYIRAKLETIRTSAFPVWAELGELLTYPGGPCVIVAQGSKDDLQATVLAEVEGTRIKRLDVCIIPSPWSAKRTGEYPT